MTSPSHKDPNHESGKTQASLPRFRGTVIPPLDSLIIKVLPPILIILVVVAVDKVVGVTIVDQVVQVLVDQLLHNGQVQLMLTLVNQLRISMEK